MRNGLGRWGLAGGLGGRALVFVAVPASSHPSLLPEETSFRIRTRYEYHRIGVERLNLHELQLRGEANTWVVDGFVIVAVEDSGFLEVVAWPQCPESETELLEQTSLYVDPASKRFLNRGGGNGYGPDGSITALAHVTTCAMLSCVARDGIDSSWIPSPGGAWRVTRESQPGIAFDVSIINDRLAKIECWNETELPRFLARVEEFPRGPSGIVDVPAVVEGAAYARLSAGDAPVVTEEWRSEILEAEKLPPDSTREEVIANLCRGLLEVRHEEYFNREAGRVGSLRRGVAAPPRSRIGYSGEEGRWVSPAVPLSSPDKDGAEAATRSGRPGTPGVVLIVLGVVAAGLAGWGWMGRTPEGKPRRKP